MHSKEKINNCIIQLAISIPKINNRNEQITIRKELIINRVIATNKGCVNKEPAINKAQPKTYYIESVS